jgi:hypothetical protein
MQTCPNMAFGGSFGFSNWGTSSPDMTLKFGTQIKEVKRGTRNFFGVRIVSGGFSMRHQRNLVASGIWATGKTYKVEILQGAFLVQFRSSEFYSFYLLLYKLAKNRENSHKGTFLNYVQRNLAFWPLLPSVTKNPTNALCSVRFCHKF